MRKLNRRNIAKGTGIITIILEIFPFLENIFKGTKDLLEWQNKLVNKIFHNSCTFDLDYLIPVIICTIIFILTASRLSYLIKTKNKRKFIIIDSIILFVLFSTTIFCFYEFIQSRSCLFQKVESHIYTSEQRKEINETIDYLISEDGISLVKENGNGLTLTFRTKNNDSTSQVIFNAVLKDSTMPAVCYPSLEAVSAKDNKSDRKRNDDGEKLPTSAKEVVDFFQELDIINHKRSPDSKDFENLENRLNKMKSSNNLVKSSSIYVLEGHLNYYKEKSKDFDSFELIKLKRNSISLYNKGKKLKLIEDIETNLTLNEQALIDELYYDNNYSILRQYCDNPIDFIFKLYNLSILSMELNKINVNLESIIHDSNTIRFAYKNRQSLYDKEKGRFINDICNELPESVDKSKIHNLLCNETLENIFLYLEIIYSESTQLLDYKSQNDFYKKNILERLNKLFKSDTENCNLHLFDKILLYQTLKLVEDEFNYMTKLYKKNDPNFEQNIIDTYKDSYYRHDTLTYNPEFLKIVNSSDVLKPIQQKTKILSDALNSYPLKKYLINIDTNKLIEKCF